MGRTIRKVMGGRGSFGLQEFVLAHYPIYKYILKSIRIYFRWPAYRRHKEIEDVFTQANFRAMGGAISTIILCRFLLRSYFT